MNLGEFSFGAPLWLWSLALVPLLFALFLRAEGRRAAALRRLVATRLQGVLAASIHPGRRRLRFFLFLAALAAFGLTLARPRYGYTFEEVRRKGRDVLIAVDVSRSMLANDVAPDRLTRAKLAAHDLIGLLGGERVGLIAFAGSAFLQAPLTVDENAVLTSLRELSPDIIPLGGTNISDVIRVAREAFGKGEGDTRSLILFTDGEELDGNGPEAARAAADAMRIFTIGVGSADGTLIPIPGERGETAFVRDPQGNFVKSRLDEARLREIAQAAGGFYLHLGNAPAQMRQIVSDGISHLKETEGEERMALHPVERYQWPLGAGIVLMMAAMLMSERRRNGGRNGRLAGTAAAVCLLALAGPGRAQTVGELYRNEQYKEAREAVEKGLERQPGSPQWHFNKGALDYATGDYDAAVEAFSAALTTGDPELRAKAEYNLATTLLRRALARKDDKTDLKNAIEHFDEALKIDPDNENAKANRELARRKLEPPPTPTPTPTPPPQDQPQDQQKDQQQDQQQDQNQQSKDDQSKDDQSGNTPPSQSPSRPEGEGQPSPTPSPTPEPHDLSGDIRADDQNSGGTPPPAGVEEKETPPGEMSEEQAKAVLDALAGEDDQPFNRKQKGRSSGFKDW